MTKKIIATDREHLCSIVDRCIEREGLECNLNHIDVSQVSLFIRTLAFEGFNGNVSKWNVSNALRMDNMFEGSAFTGDISKWNTSSVVNMSNMFSNSAFKGDISNWDVSNVEDMHHMFSGSVFTGNLTQWNFSKKRKSFREKMKGFFEDIQSHDYQGISIPTLDIPCQVLFNTQHSKNLESMHTWLASQPMSRYHWDVLIEYNDAPWGTPAMMEHIRAWFPMYRTMGYTDLDIAQTLLNHWQNLNLHASSQCVLPLILEDSFQL